MATLIDELNKRVVWEAAAHAPPLDPIEWRRDQYGNLIRWSEYGDRQKPNGWEIDHVLPSVFGGIDHVSNMRALHYRTNASLGGLAAAVRNALPPSAPRGLGGLSPFPGKALGMASPRK